MSDFEKGRFQKGMELIIQVGHYAGWPAMAHALIQYEEVLNEDAGKKK